MARKRKIKSCVILNPPATPEKKEALSQRSAKALAQALHRALSPGEYECLIKSLKKPNSRLNKNKVAI
jgi:hypothetical protein